MAKDQDKTGRTPIVSRLLADGTAIEMLHDAEAGITGLAICAPSGEIELVDHYDLPTKERLVPYSAANNLLASGCVLLPSEVGDYDGKEALLADIRTFIHHYVDLSPLYEEIAAHYVLLTWVHDAFNELPYLRFRGEYGTGKTRALLAVGSLCYKPFFASGASTVSPIFHVLDAFGGTLILDEADFRFSDATADLTKILNNGNMRGLPVLRTMSNRHRELNPQAFKVFGPKIIGMRERFADDALESRFLTEETGGRGLRADIDVHLPETMRAGALALRNRLLAWRFAELPGIAIHPERAVAGLSPRGNQTGLALLSLVDDEALRARMAEDLVASEARVATKRALSPPVTMVGVLDAMFRSAHPPYLPIADITALFNEVTGQRGERPLPIKAVGSLVRRLGLATVKSHGVYVIPQSERQKVDALAARHGLRSVNHTAAPKETRVD